MHTTSIFASKADACKNKKGVVKNIFFLSLEAKDFNGGSDDREDNRKPAAVEDASADSTSTGADSSPKSPPAIAKKQPEKGRSAN